MGWNRNTLQLILLCAGAWLVWTTFARAAHETVTLHIADVRNQDHFARVWVVDARPYLWIRAERPDRRWLQALREKPRLTLGRHGHRGQYEARVWDGPEARREIDALFREKYGLADWIRSLLFERETIPVRLDRV